MASKQFFVDVDLTGNDLLGISSLASTNDFSFLTFTDTSLALTHNNGSAQGQVTFSNTDGVLNLLAFGESNSAVKISGGINGNSSDANLLLGSDLATLTVQGSIFMNHGWGSLQFGATNLLTDNNGVGLQYAADYSSGYVDRSLVDKGYVDAAITGGAFTFQNGLTEMSGIVSLGGTLLQNTSVSGDNSYSMTFDVAGFIVNSNSSGNFEAHVRSTNLVMGDNDIEIAIGNGQAVMNIGQGDASQWEIGAGSMNIVGDGTTSILSVNGNRNGLELHAPSSEILMPSGGQINITSNGGDGLFIEATNIVSLVSGGSDGIQMDSSNQIEIRANTGSAGDFHMYFNNGASFELVSPEGEFHIVNGGQIKMFTKNGGVEKYGVTLDYFGAMVYDADYSADFLPRTLVDKEYVDNAIIGGAFNLVDGSGTFIGGYSTSGYSINLGGALTQNTDITGPYVLNIGTSANKLAFATVNTTDGIILSDNGNGGGITLDAREDGGVLISNRGDSSGVQLDGATTAGALQTRFVVGTSAYFLDNRVTPVGIEYDSNYSATFTNRSLVDKQYVDNKVTSGAFNLVDGSGTTIGGSSTSGQSINLGGSVTVDTTLTGGNIYDLRIQNFDVLELQATNVLNLNSDNGNVNVYANQQLAVNADGTMTFDSVGAITFETDEDFSISVGAGSQSVNFGTSGLAYGADYSGQYSNRSLVDKEYVDVTVANGVTAINGLTKDGHDIKLGGLLTESTTIDGGGNRSFTITDPYEFKVQNGDGRIAFGGDGDFYIAAGGHGLHVIGDAFGAETEYGSIFYYQDELRIGSTNNGLAPAGFVYNFEFLPASAKFADNRTGGANVGLEYAADYSANYTTRSLVDKEYVDTLVGGVTASNGLTKTGSDIALGGSVTTDTVIDITGGSTFAITSAASTGSIGFDASGTVIITGVSGGDTLYASSNGIVVGSDTYGIQYTNDLRTTFVNESLITKRYADTRLLSKPTPAVPTGSNNGQSLRWNNGTNLWEYFTASDSTFVLSDGSGTTIGGNGTSGYSINLGGTLNENTTIDLNDKYIEFLGNYTSGNVTDFYLLDGQIGASILDVGTGMNSSFGISNQISLNSTDNNTTFGTNLIIGSSLIVAGSNDPSFTGITYNANYSANYTNRSLVDKEYVDDAVGVITNAKYKTNITGDTVAVSFVITHNLGTRDVMVQLFSTGSPYDTVETSVERTTTNTVTLTFNTAPTGSETFTVLVQSF